MSLPKIDTSLSGPYKIPQMEKTLLRWIAKAYTVRDYAVEIKEKRTVAALIKRGYVEKYLNNTLRLTSAGRRLAENMKRNRKNA